MAGITSFGSGNPAALPVFGLAFGAAALVRESRGSRRKPIFVASGLGCLVCGLGTIVSLLVVHR
jgi:hypothetical protein